MANAGGWQKHVWFKKESTWGTPVTADIWLPVDAYDVVAKPEFYSNAGAFVGVRQRKAPNHPLKTMLNGSITCDMFGYQVTSGSLKSVAQHLIDMAVSAPAGLDLDSFTVNQYDPNDQKAHAGLRIGTCTISGSADQGAIKMTLAVEGNGETVVSSPSLVHTVPHYKSMMFRDATFALGGSAVTLRSFELTINNTLVVKHTNSQWPSVIAAMSRIVDYKFTLFKTANTYDALRRATSVTDITGELVLKGDHHGTTTNTYTTMTVAIDRMNFAGADDNSPKDDLWEQNLSYMILKPNTTDNDIDITWGTAS